MKLAYIQFSENSKTPVEIIHTIHHDPYVRFLVDYSPMYRKDSKWYIPHSITIIPIKRYVLK